MIWPAPPVSEDLARFEVEHQFPLDVTALASQDLGEQLSFWTAMRARALVMHGVAEGELLRAETAYSHYYAKAFYRADKENEDGKRRLKESINADALADERVKEWTDKRMVAKAEVVMLKNMVEAYRGYVECLSREITRRQVEADAGFGRTT
ncbi:MAG: hypothetical protein JRN42_07170 [Nitrososphaerota archaeon]|nr:hypothetical protein [Nitrososphaerota archaeon]